MGRVESSSVSDLSRNNILAFAAWLSKELSGLPMPHCVIGGIAYLRWGEPRQTADEDADILAGLGDEERLARTLTTMLPSRIDDPLPFAIQNRIVLLRNEDGVEFDVSLGALPFEHRMMERASDWTVPDHETVRT